MEQFAVFSISTEIFGIPIAKVVEIVKPQKVFSIPGLPDFLSGVMSVRGLVIPLIDLRRRFGVNSTGKKERIIVTRFGKEKIGLLVDEIREIFTFSAGEISAPPSFFKGFKAEYITGLGSKDDSIIILLDIDRLLSSEERIQLMESIGKLGAGGAGVAGTEQRT
jgi:purine-binding chemotaxis protein CheW